MSTTRKDKIIVLQGIRLFAVIVCRDLAEGRNKFFKRFASNLSRPLTQLFAMSLTGHLLPICRDVNATYFTNYSPQAAVSLMQLCRDHTTYLMQKSF
jgi:hypothetical protein